jgi:hypothetical protein
MRALAQSRMLDTFDIKVPTGTAYTGGVDVTTYDYLFTTLGRVKVEGGLSVRDSQVGDRTSASVVRTLSIPVDSDHVPAGAVAICTDVHATSDPTLLGAVLTLGGPAPGSQTTARRLEVTEVLT